MENTNIYKQSDNFLQLTSKNIIWAILGIIFGLVINNIVVFLIKKYNINNKYGKVLIHIILCAIILSFIQIYINNYFGWSWQNVTPGLYFVSFFFGVQYNVFNTLSQ
jgi:uncharacterized protein YacL